MRIKVEKRTDLENIPKRNWNKTLIAEWDYRQDELEAKYGKSQTLKIWAVRPQAHLIGYTQTAGLLEDFSSDAILVKAFEKNYKTAAKPGVVSNYGFEKAHGEPIEQLSYVFECIYDRACEAEMNRYRHNSKNYESGRYVDYIKHGLTVVLPEDIKGLDWTHPRYQKFIRKVKIDLEEYVDVILDAENLHPSKRKQQARRRIGTYIAVESTYTTNLRSLVHMGRQRSAKLSPNGQEAEPQISEVVTSMVENALPYLPVFAQDVMTQIGKGYR